MLNQDPRFGDGSEAAVEEVRVDAVGWANNASVPNPDRPDFMLPRSSSLTASAVRGRVVFNGFRYSRAWESRAPSTQD